MEDQIRKFEENLENIGRLSSDIKDEIEQSKVAEDELDSELSGSKKLIEQNDKPEYDVMEYQ